MNSEERTNNGMVRPFRKRLRKVGDEAQQKSRPVDATSQICDRSLFKSSNDTAAIAQPTKPSAVLNTAQPEFQVSTPVSDIPNPPQPELPVSIPLSIPLTASQPRDILQHVRGKAAERLQPRPSILRKRRQRNERTGRQSGRETRKSGEKLHVNNCHSKSNSTSLFPSEPDLQAVNGGSQPEQGPEQGSSSDVVVTSASAVQTLDQHFGSLSSSINSVGDPEPNRLSLLPLEPDLQGTNESFKRKQGSDLGVAIPPAGTDHQQPLDDSITLHHCSLLLLLSQAVVETEDARQEPCKRQRQPILPSDSEPLSEVTSPRLSSQAPVWNPCVTSSKGKERRVEAAKRAARRSLLFQESGRWSFDDWVRNRASRRGSPSAAGGMSDGSPLSRLPARLLSTRASSVSPPTRDSPLGQQTIGRQPGAQSPGTRIVLVSSPGPSEALVDSVPGLPSVQAEVNPRARRPRVRSAEGKATRTSARVAAKASSGQNKSRFISTIGIGEGSAGSPSKATSEKIVSPLTRATPSEPITGTPIPTEAVGTMSHQCLPSKKNGSSKRKRTTQPSKAHSARRPSKRQNSRQITAKRTPSSEYKGVTHFTRTNRYEAHIWNCREKRQEYLGSHSTEVLAARAYDRANIYFKGVDAELHFPLANYEEELPQLMALTKEQLRTMLKQQSHGAQSSMFPTYPI